MSKGGVAFGIILIVFAFILFPLLLDSFDDMGKESITTSATVTTGVGETVGNITLNSSLYDANTDNIIELSSTESSDDPAPAEYYENTDALEVSGLSASTSRTITVEYYSERDTGYLSSLIPVAPFFIFAMFLAGGAGLIYKSVRR